MIIAIMNQKGGVGKTTTAINLAATLAERKQKVLLLDMDAQCNATNASGAATGGDTLFDVLLSPDEVPLESVIVEGKAPGVQVAPGHWGMAGLEARLRDVIGREHILDEVLEPLAGRFDFIVIDLGPSLGLASSMAMGASDLVMVPVAAQHFAMQGLADVNASIEQVKRRLNRRLQKKILLTMVDGRTSHSPSLARAVREKFGEEVFESEIGQSAELQRAPDHRDQGGAIIAYAPKSAAAGQFRDLAVEVSAFASRKDGHG